MEKSFFEKIKCPATISNITITIKDQYDKIFPNFLARHLIIRFSKRLYTNGNKSFSNTDNIKNYSNINKIMLLVSGYILNLL